MRFSQDFPDKLRSSILVSEVVGKKVQLKKKGKEYQGLCPFHNEKTPSFTVNDQKGFYHCFGCQAHGDIITFVMNKEGLDFKEAVVSLANEFGIEVDVVKNSQSPNTDIWQRKYEISEKICQFFEKNLYENFASEARKYLQKRGLNSQVAKKFRIGFAPDSYESLTNFLKNNHFNDKEILESGVVGKNDRGKLYDKMRNRVIFPITNKKNQVIAFGARTISNELPKYLNSSETEIFKKNQTLFNFANARKSIFDNQFALIVEGYLDVISLDTNGVENVVAGLGTAIGFDHLKQLFQITDKIIICLDGDSAGIKASRRLCEIALPLISSTKNIALAILPNNQDPDDFIKKLGKKNFLDYVSKSPPLSQSLFDFALQDLGLNNKTKIYAEDRSKLEDILNKKTALIADSASKKHFANFFKDSLYLLSRNSFKELNQNQVKPTRINQYSLNNLNQKQAQNNFLPIIALIVIHPTLVDYQDDIFNLREMNFSNEIFTNFKDFVVELIDDGQKNLLEMLENSDFSSYNMTLKTMIAGLIKISFESCKEKLRLMLLKDLVFQLEIQYQELLTKTEELQTHQSAITNNKIREIFDYKNSLQLKIIEIEKNFS